MSAERVKRLYSEIINDGNTLPLRSQQKRSRQFARDSFNASMLPPPPPPAPFSPQHTPRFVSDRNASFASAQSVRGAVSARKMKRDQDYLHLFELESIAQGGSRITYDSAQLRKSTIKSIKSHLKLLEHNEVDIRSLRNADLNAVLDELRLKGNGELLSPGYKLQLGNSIMKALGNQAIYDPSVYRAQKRPPTAHTATPELMSDIEQLVEYASRLVRESLSEYEIKHLAVYDTALVVLLTTSTSMHLEELMQLTMRDVYLILLGEPIYIKSKNSRNDQRRVLRNALLNSTLYAIIINRKASLTAAILTDNNRASEFKSARVMLDKIILTSESQLSRVLRSFATIIGVRIDKLGFTKFRKFTISLLVENGASEVAQFANMHSKLRTTINNYYISTTRQLTNVQNDLTSNSSPSTAQTATLSSPTSDRSTTRMSTSTSPSPQAAASTSGIDKISASSPSDLAGVKTKNPMEVGDDETGDDESISMMSSMHYSQTHDDYGNDQPRSLREELDGLMTPPATPYHQAQWTDDD